MSQYRVLTDDLELPQGSCFTTLPSLFSVARGDLALFAIRDSLLVGRWYPSPDGAHWIQLPGIRIDLSKESFRIVGAVVPVEMTIKTITNLPEAEYGQFLSTPFPRMLDS